MTGNGTSVLLVVLLFVGVALAFAWILLPFILMGTNSELRRILREQQRTNQLLEDRLPDLSPRPPRG